MADTQRSLSAILALAADNTSGNISPQDLRDVIVSLQNDHGQLYEQANASATACTVADTYYVANMSGTTLTASHNFDSPSSGRLRYTGAADRVLHIACSISMTAGSNNVIAYLDLAKNGTVGGEGRISRKIGTGADVGAAAAHWVTSVSTNDYIELFVACDTGSTNITIVDLNLQAVGMIA